MMTRSLASFAVATALVLASGCNQNGSSPTGSELGTVAIIDLDLIAARLGSDKQMVDSISRRQTALNQQLAELARSYSQQIKEKKEALPQEPAEGGVTLAAFEQAAATKLQKIKLQAAQDLSSHKAQLVRQFRDQIRPVAREVARQRGLSIIVTKNDSVVYDYAGGVDITEGVLAALQNGASTAEAADRETGAKTEGR